MISLLGSLSGHKEDWSGCERERLSRPVKGHRLDFRIAASSGRPGQRKARNRGHDSRVRGFGGLYALQLRPFSRIMVQTY
jgi:hypothetical protein